MAYFVIGKSLPHSFSPAIHGSLGNDNYSIKELPTEEILHQFMTDKNFEGINITIPYKQTVLKYCDEISREVDAIGCANTIVNNSGKLCAYNTDIDGMGYMLNISDISLSGKNVVILGSGGTSLTAQYLCKISGAASITAISRTGDCDYVKLKTLSNTQVIINTTPVGMYPNTSDIPDIDFADFPILEAVCDVIYNPLRTNLIIKAKNAGLKTCTGLSMLVAQAAFAHKHFFSTDVNFEKVADITSTLAFGKSNILLIGMPGCGKSKNGKNIAKKLGREFIDTDECIVKKIGTDIPSFFAEHGEAAFREVETEVLREVTMTGGKVIATGGGCVLKPENQDIIRQNSITVFIHRDINTLDMSGRPLSTDMTALQSLAKIRLPIYNELCDIKVNCGDTSDITTSDILKELQK